MERAENRRGEEKLSIRFHHIGLWYDLYSAYKSSFGEINPWQIPPGNEHIIDEFVDTYVDREMDKWEAAQNYFEEISSYKSARKKLEYIYDLNGAGEEAKKGVTSKRKELYKRFFDIASEGTSFIPLTLDEDDYCGTCAVGNHCKQSNRDRIFKQNRDYVFQKALKRINEENSLEGLLSENEKGIMMIAPQLLFKQDFYDSLWKSIRDGGDGEWI